MAPKRGAYAALDGGTSDELDRESKQFSFHGRHSASIGRLITVLLAISNLLFLVAFFLDDAHAPEKDHGFKTQTGIHVLPPKEIEWVWFSEYSTNSEIQSPEVDALWDSIEADHGIVAVSHEWAAEKGLPRSMDWPTDTSKGFYLMESYHQIHCVKLLRTMFYQAVNGEKLNSTVRASHCFDSLRQHIMCTASDDLMRVATGIRTGNGQTRKCRDWSTLRKWATEHTACDSEGAASALFPTQNICHGDSDGLPPEINWQ